MGRRFEFRLEVVVEEAVLVQCCYMQHSFTVYTESRAGALEGESEHDRLSTDPDPGLQCARSSTGGAEELIGRRRQVSTAGATRSTTGPPYRAALPRHPAVELELERLDASSPARRHPRRHHVRWGRSEKLRRTARSRRSCGRAAETFVVGAWTQYHWSPTSSPIRGRSSA